MGTFFLGNDQYGDDGRDAGDRGFTMVRPATVAVPIPDFDFAARRLAISLRKNAARRYIRTPAFLDAISPGLSVSDPARIAAVCAHKAEFGGSPLGALVQPVNLAGARLYARWLRRFGDRDDAAAPIVVAGIALEIVGNGLIGKRIARRAA